MSAVEILLTGLILNCYVPKYHTINRVGLSEFKVKSSEIMVFDLVGSAKPYRVPAENCRIARVQLTTD